MQRHNSVVPSCLCIALYLNEECHRFSGCFSVTLSDSEIRRHLSGHNLCPMEIVHKEFKESHVTAPRQRATANRLINALNAVQWTASSNANWLAAQSSGLFAEQIQLLSWVTAFIDQATSGIQQNSNGSYKSPKLIRCFSLTANNFIHKHLYWVMCR